MTTNINTTEYELLAVVPREAEVRQRPGILLADLVDPRFDTGVSHRVHFSLSVA